MGFDKVKAPAICMDIDGVLADFSFGFSSLAEGVYGYPARGGARQPDWHFPYTKKETDKIWEMIEHSSRFWANLHPLITAADAYALHELACEVPIYYVTNRRTGIDFEQQTRGWLLDFGLPDWDNVVVTDDKAQTIKLLGLSHILEDSPHNLERIAAKLTSEGLWRREWPYNSTCPGIPVPSVEAFVGEVMEDING